MCLQLPHCVQLTVCNLTASSSQFSGSHVELTVIWFRVARWRGGRRWKGLTRSRTWPRLGDIKKAMRINISKRMSGDVGALYHVKEVAVKHSRFHIFSNVLHTFHLFDLESSTALFIVFVFQVNLGCMFESDEICCRNERNLKFDGQFDKGSLGSTSKNFLV